MTDETRLADVIGNYCHIDGPHTSDTVIDAAESISALVRYLNHATMNRAGTQLEWAQTIYSVVSNLSGAMHGCDQLLRQLADALDHQATLPKLYDDRRDRPGSQTAIDAAVQLEAARHGAGVLATCLDIARDFAGHLGNDD